MSELTVSNLEERQSDIPYGQPLWRNENDDVVLPYETGFFEMPGKSREGGHTFYCETSLTAQSSDAIRIMLIDHLRPRPEDTSPRQWRLGIVLLKRSDGSDFWVYAPDYSDHLSLVKDAQSQVPIGEVMEAQSRMQVVLTHNNDGTCTPEVTVRAPQIEGVVKSLEILFANMPIQELGGKDIGAFIECDELRSRPAWSPYGFFPDTSFPLNKPFLKEQSLSDGSIRRFSPLILAPVYMRRFIDLHAPSIRKAYQYQ